jgi:hypothetical protein
MRAAVARTAGPTGEYRLLADVKALGGDARGKRVPAHIRLEAALGRDFADRLVSALLEAQTEDRRR